MPLTAIILAAGEGSRMKSSHPKVMHKLLDKPMCWWTAEAARKAGADHIVIVVGFKSEEVISYFKSIHYEDKVHKLSFVTQPTQQGTGHAVMCVAQALKAFSGPVCVLFGDGPLITPETIQDLVAFNKAHHNACSVLGMTPPDCAGYGRLDLRGHELVAIIEDKDCTPDERERLRVCNSGIMCFCGRRLSRYINELSCDNAQHEYYLTDMVALLRAHKEPVSCIQADDYHELLGVNDPIQLAEATKIMQMRINTKLMSEGVCMLAPEQVWIGAEVEVGTDTEILPQSFLFGQTKVGQGSVIGPQSRLIDAEVGNMCTIDETVIVSSTVDDGVACGPRAYIRGHAHLKNNSKAGTHVEIKGSEIGEGTKVPHLSYIGDAKLGSHTNIGGGSITCNYDGKHKSHTEIGDHVFIGSDTMLVAPVTIGDNALIGASSCITKNVPAGALGLERSKLLVKEQWATQYWETLQKED